MIFSKIDKLIADLAQVTTDTEKRQLVFRCMADFFPEALESMELRVHCRSLAKDARVARFRTDKIREAVAKFLAGELSKKRLERALHETDYSYSIGEDCDG